MRSKLQTAGISLIVFLISAVFILEFGGPQSQGCGGSTATSFAAAVYGETISVGEFRAAYMLANGPRFRPQQARELQIKERVLGGLIERNLLAREARKLGFSLEQEDVMKRLAEDGVIYTSAAVGSPPSIPRGPQTIRFEDEDGNFDAKEARRFIQNRLGRSVEEFAISQIQETLAQRMREVFAATVQISEKEVWSAFVRERDRATLRYARFDRAFYEGQVPVTDAAVKAWMPESTEIVDAEYEKQKHRFTGLEKQVKARHILIKADAAGGDEAKAMAKAEAEAARKRVLDGEDFTKLAAELSQDTGSARRGGDLGYNVRGRMVAPFDEAQFALKPGEISEVIETQFGFHVIKVEGVREGDVPIEEAKLELARKLYKETRAGELAKQAAAQAQALLDGGANMDDLSTQLTAQAEASDKKTLAPKVAETRSFSRADSPIPGLDAGPLVEQAFELDMESPRGKAPLSLGESWVVYELTQRESPSKEDYEKTERLRLRNALLSRKRSEAVDQYVYRLRKTAADGDEISINSESISYPTSNS